MKLWSTQYADSMFSKRIRERDKLCRRCKIKRAKDNSHFWRRGHSGTRYDFNNCVGVCRPCHDIWEHQKNNEYKDFMLSWLGEEEYNLVEKRARGFKKRSDAVIECMRLLET